MPKPTVRYAVAGTASAMGVVLLGLAVFSDPAAVLAQFRPHPAISTAPSANPAGLVMERDSLRDELTGMQQQMADLTSQIAQLGTELANVRKPTELLAGIGDNTNPVTDAQAGNEKSKAPPADVATATPAPSDAPAKATPVAAKQTGTLRERLERAETCLIEARSQEAELLLESILFQLLFRPEPGQNVQTTASMIIQALAAVAAADLEKAAYYTDQAQPRL